MIEGKLQFYLISCELSSMFNENIKTSFRSIVFAVPTKFQISSIEITVLVETQVLSVSGYIFQHRVGRNKINSSLSLFRPFVSVLPRWRDLYPSSCIDRILSVAMGKHHQDILCGLTTNL